MKNLYYYLSESEVNYTYRIKLVPDMSNEKLNVIENVLSKYRLLNISKPYKMDIRDFQSDFKDMKTIQHVFVVDIELGLPVSAYILQQELRAVLNIPEREIIVRSERDRMEIENQVNLVKKDICKTAKDKGLKPAALMTTEIGYKEFKPAYDDKMEDCLYGNEYNKKLLDYLGQIAHDRTKEPKKSITPLFSWLNSPIGTQDDSFNKDYDTPKSEPVWKRNNTAPTRPTDKVTRYGQMDDIPIVVAGKYQDDKGKTS